MDEEGVWLAYRRGVNYWNWCGHPDGLRDAIRHLGDRRDTVCVAVQFEARTGRAAVREFDRLCAELNTDVIDVITYYYVQSADEWASIQRGAHRVLKQLKQEGRIRLIGLTTHRRKLAAELARSGQLDLLMIRYNAAHRGAEREVFPVVRACRLPTVAFTCLRWGHLLRPVPAEGGEKPLSAVECYRYVLSNPDVSVALMAPGNRRELQENLTLLDDWRPVTEEERERIEAFGRLVYRHRRYFP